MAEKIRDSIAIYDMGDVGRITVGLTESRPDNNEQSLFQRADARLCLPEPSVHYWPVQVV